MSVLAEGISIIIRTETLRAVYPGGPNQFAVDSANGWLCADAHLTRVGFMRPDDVERSVRWLTDSGLVFVEGGRCIDFAVVDQHEGPTAPCDWLRFAPHEDGYGVAWLAAQPQGALQVPAGWSLEHSLTRTGQFVPNEAVEERLLYLGNRHGVEAYFDNETGAEVYIGDTLSADRDRGGVPALYARGSELEMRQQFTEALACYDAAISQQPDAAPVWHAKARLLDRLNRRVEALHCYERINVLHPGNIGAWFAEGSLLGRMGRFADAAACFAQATALDPRSHDAWYLRGISLAHAGLFAEALACQAELLTLDPGSAKGWYEQGVNLLRLGRREDAIAAYRTCVECDPGHEQAWANLGGLLAGGGATEQGLAALDRALALDPGDPFAWRHRGQALEALGRADEAIEAYTQTMMHASWEQSDLGEAAHASMIKLRIANEDIAVAEQRIEAERIARRMLPGPACREVEGAHGAFGRAASNPIPGDGCNYCARLRCPQGHPFWFQRLGSVGFSPDGHMVDQVELICFGGESHDSLFFDMYHYGDAPDLPAELSAGQPAGRGTTHQRLALGAQRSDFIASIESGGDEFTPPFHRRPPLQAIMTQMTIRESTLGLQCNPGRKPRGTPGD